MDTIYENISVIEHYSFKHDNYYILMDVNDQNIYILDETENIIVEAYKQNIIKEKLNELEKRLNRTVVKQTINDLVKNGILKNDLDNKLIKKESHYDVNMINSIDLLISEDCNLACKYCYVKNGHYQGKVGLMTVDIGKKAIDFLIQKSGDKCDLFLCFFGGEPLLNFEVLKDIVAYALEKGETNNKLFHFTMSTNGILLTDEIVEFIAKHRFNVTISIDGDKSSHNQNRPMQKRGDSYTTLINNIKKLDQLHVSYAARTTVSSYTKDKVADNFEHLASLGFKRIHIENAYSPKGKVFVSKADDIKEIKNQFSLITEKIIKKIESGMPTAIEPNPFPLRKIINKRMNTRSCVAGLGYVAVDMRGDIYLCHRLVGEKEFLLGNVVDGQYRTILPQKIADEFDVDKRESCKKCWARYICGGGCYAINYVFSNDIYTATEIFCEHMKHAVKCALVVYSHAGKYDI